MNEQLEKIWDKARDEVEQTNPQSWKIVDVREKFAELIVRQCGYYADVFDAMECPVDMDPTETKPSDYIKREMGITE